MCLTRVLAPFVEAVAWTAIDALTSRIDSLEGRLAARLDALSARLDEHLRRHAS